MTWEEINGWMIFSARLINPQRERGDGEYIYGSSIRVDNEGYVLADLAEYNASIEPADINARRMDPPTKYNQWNSLRGRLAGNNYRIDDSYLEIEGRHNEGRDTRWERPQFIIETIYSTSLYEISPQLDALIFPLVQKKIRDFNEQTTGLKLRELDDDENGLIFNFSNGGGVIRIDSGSQHRAFRFFLPRNVQEKDKCWIAIKKEVLTKSNEHERERIRETIQTSYLPIWEAERIVSTSRDELLNRIGNDVPLPPNNNTPNVPDNTVIQQYNNQITKKLEEFQDRNDTLLEDADLKIGLLMSLEKYDLPEVETQVDLIFQPQELMKYKEELKGDGEDAARQTNNQTIETRNAQLIQEWENNFARRQTAVNELQKILDRISNPDTQENPNNNGQQNSNGSDNGSPNRPINPIIENNQQSEENIRNINQNISLEEAKQRTKQEINDSLDRHGVKSTELNESLWVNQSNWETYLNALTTIEQITDFVKKMKSAIIQRNNQNNQVNKKLSVSQLQDKVAEEIKELLKKHSLVKETDLPIKGQNWEEKLRSLTTQQQVLSLARQLRETIIQQSNQQKQKQKQKQKPSSAILLKIAIPVGLGFLGTLAAGIFIIRHRRIAHLKIKNKRKSVNN